MLLDAGSADSTGDPVQLYTRNEITLMAVASWYVNVFQSTLFIGLVFMFAYMMLQILLHINVA